MFLTQREPERGRLINFRYGTAGTTTQTTLASSGGLLINIDNAIGDIARTTDGWNEDEKYGVYSDILTVGASSEFDSAVTRTGRLTYKASTTDITGTINGTIGLGGGTTATLGLGNLYKYAMPIKASTKYKATCWIKTNNVVTNSAFLQSTTYNSVGTRLTVTSSNKLSGTNDWTLCSINITSDATATHIVFVLANQLAGNISDAWFDINSMTLEEVVEPVAHTFDQSFLTFTPGTALIGAFTGTNYMQSQSFTPAVSNLSGIVLYKLTNTGTPTGNLKIDIRTSSVGDPTSTVLATQTISLSEWNLIPVGEFVVNLGASLTIGTKYSIVLTNTATETGSNGFRIGGLAAGGYAGGDTRYSDDGGTVWVVNGTYDLFFKTFSSSLTSSSPSLVSFTAVGSTDNIDQSQLGVSTNVGLDTPARFGAQQFTPTKSKLTGVVFQKHTTTGTPTGDIIFRIATDSGSDNPTTTILASYTMPSATYNTLSVGVDFTINLPCNLTAGTKYWILFNYSIASLTDFPLLKAATPATAYTGGIYKYGSDGVTYGTTFAGDVYFKTLYYKPTTNFKASQNNSTVSISADEDGFLEAGKINLLTGQYTFDIRDVPKVGTGLGHIFNNTVVTGLSTGLIFDVLSGVEYQLRTGTTAYVEGVLKVKIPGGLTNLTIKALLRRAGASYSTDGVSYTTMLDNTGSSTAAPMNYTIAGPVTTLYIKLFSNNGFGGTCYYAQSTDPFTITGTLDVSSLSTLRNYPTNKDIIKQYSTTLGSATTSATYRATKWGFPAIEYGSDTNVDQSQATMSGTGIFGNASRNFWYQQFLPTKTRLTGIVLQRGSNGGTFVGDITIKIRDNNAGNPGTTVLASYTIPNATWNAIPINTDYTVSLPATLTADGSTTYWIQYGCSTSDAGNYTALNVNGSNVYPSGACKYGVIENVPVTTYGGDTLFKTLYSTIETQYLDVDTTATGSTVAFSELGSSYTTVADGASIAITSTSTPSIWVKTNITANRMYLSSNDFNASSDKDGSNRQSVVYQVIQ